MHHGFSSSHFKGPMFLFLSSHWCSLAVPTSRQPVASWHPWLDGQYQPESPPLPAGLAFWFWGPSRCREGSWSEHIHQRQQECWSLVAQPKPGSSETFPGLSHMHGIWTNLQDIHQERAMTASSRPSQLTSLSPVLSPELLLCTHFS